MIEEWNPEGLSAPSTPDGDRPKPRSPLDLLLEGSPDDVRAVDATDPDFRALEDEWRVLAILKERHDRLTKLLDEAKASYNAQKERMAAAMQAQGTRQYASTEGRGAGSLAHEYRTRVTDAQAFLQWVTETHPELLGVNAQRRDSFVRNQFRDQGISPDDPAFPPGIEVVEQDVLRVRNVRAANQEEED